MARPLRIEFPGALYHVTSRGDRREDIYADDEDRNTWLVVLGEVCERYRWVIHAYCLMSNHYHLLVQTLDAGLAAGMRQLNGVYTQRVNQRHRRVGHVFQGRYQAVLVDREAHLLEVARYVVLNPVRAGMVNDSGAWPWSSYRAMVGAAPPPPWLQVNALLRQFASTRAAAVAAYVDHVRAGVGLPSIWGRLNQQLYLGDDAFVARMQRAAASARLDDLEVPVPQRRAPAPPLASFVRTGAARDAAMARAYASGAYTLGEIAQAFGVHYTTVSRAVRRLAQAPRPVEGRAATPSGAGVGE